MNQSTTKSSAATGRAFQESIVRALRTELDRRFAKLEGRIAAMEGKSATLPGGLNYAGTWREGKAFEPGQFATHTSSLWHCNRSTMDKPGVSPDWTLAVRGAR